METLILLFLVFITYSHSIDVKYVLTDNTLTILNSTINDGYFYFSTTYISHNYLYLNLFDRDYNLNNTISYCRTNIRPFQAISSCNFISKYYDDNDYPGTSKGYFYKIPLDKSYYLIIKYSGNNSYGTIKARGSFSNLIEKISIDASSDTSLTKYNELFNYFYAYIDNSNPSYDYLFFYFDDPYNNLKDPIYYCRTNNNPEVYSSIIRDCYFSTLYYDEKNPTGKYDFSYKVDISSYHGGYVIVRYSVSSSYNLLYVKGLYNKSKKITILAIVFFVIAGVFLVSITITVIYCCCSCFKRIASNNNAYVQNQPALVVPEQPALIVPEQPALAIQTPSYPFVQQNNLYPT